jgi:anti-anti-sigma factor
MTDETTMRQVDLSIAGELSIYRADELKRALIEPLAQGVQLVVNLAAVTEFDTCGLQLLMLAKRTAQALGSELQLVGHSPAVLEVFELLNVAAFFGDHLVIAPGRHRPKAFRREEAHHEPRPSPADFYCRMP